MNKDLVELRKKNLEQLNSELIATRQEQFNLRIKHNWMKLISWMLQEKKLLGLRL